VEPFDFSNAFYIKLGRGGVWEPESIQTGKLRLGWKHQSTDDIKARRWEVIEQQLRAEHDGKPQVATNDLNRLRDIAESGPEDVWITFHQSKLWWTRLASTPVEQDETSKFRRTSLPWSDRNAKSNLLVVNELPGKLSQLQGFRGTVCRVQHADVLRRVLAGTPSPLASAITAQRRQLAEQLAQAIQELHWKDFETLVDLVFRDAGWIRVSVLGQQAKGYDLELREPITGDRYVVQVKSRAGVADLKDTVACFSDQDYRRVFFVVHTPDDDLAAAVDLPDHVQVMPPLRLAEQTIDAGLASWIEDKVS
jgi:Restriction endonuclease